MEAFNDLNLLDKMTTINIKMTIIMNTVSRMYRLFPHLEHNTSVPSTNKLAVSNSIAIPPRNLRTNPKNCIKHVNKNIPINILRTFSKNSFDLNELGIWSFAPKPEPEVELTGVVEADDAAGWLLSAVFWFAPQLGQNLELSGNLLPHL